MNKSEQLISCLEGEIAKRDARIVELERALKSERDTESGAIYQLRAELAAIKAQEPVPVATIRQDNDLLWQVDGDPSKWRQLGDGTKLYAAPVSEAKAQGVVMPERKTKADYGVYIDEFADEAAAIYNAALDEVARLNAAPVQQVSVPECFAKLLHHAHGMTMGADWNKGTMAGYHREPLGEAVVQCQAWLNAAPAAAAADAGLVEALEMALEIGDGCSRGFLGKFQAKARAAIAAHRAKGVA